MSGKTWQSLLEHVRTLVKEQRLCSAGDTIIVAVSGGSDSVALLHVLHALSDEYQWKLVCAHLNHGFRPEESAQEAQYVAKISSDLHIPFELEEVSTPDYMVETGQGPQEAARTLRYDFLHRIAEKWSAHSIALAHHMDDQAETVLMRILRGSGAEGLSGIKMRRTEKNVELIRPFLRIYKTTLIHACEECDFGYITDSSNLHRKYTRNRIRLDVLPFLEQFNEQLVPSLARLAEIVGTENDYIQQETGTLYAELVKEEEGSFSFEVTSFVEVHVALQRRLIKLILSYLSPSYEQFDFSKIEMVRGQIMQSGLTSWSLDIGDKVTCVREYQNIRFIRGVPKFYEPYCIPILRNNEVISIPFTKEQLDIRLLPWNRNDSDQMELSSEEAFFDADLLTFPLCLRSRRQGDSFKLTEKGGTKKVKNLFIDEKIPLSQRNTLPLLADFHGQVLWIPGIRRSGSALVHPGTSCVVHMRRIKTEENV